MSNKFILIGGLSASLLLAGCTSDFSNDGVSSDEKYTLDEVEKRDADVKKEESKKKAEADFGKWYEVGDKFKDEYDLTGIVGYERDHNGLPVGVSLEFSNDSSYGRFNYTYTLLTDTYVKLKLDRHRPYQYIVKVTEIDPDRNRVRLKVEEVN